MCVNCVENILNCPINRPLGSTEYKYMSLHSNHCNNHRILVNIQVIRSENKLLPLKVLPQIIKSPF